MATETASPVSIALREYDKAISRANYELARACAEPHAVLASAKALHAKTINDATERCQATLDAHETDGIKVRVEYRPAKEHPDG